MLGLSIKEESSIFDGDYKIVVTMRTENSMISNIIGGKFRTIDQAVAFLAEGGLNYSSSLFDDGKVSVKIVKGK